MKLINFENSGLRKFEEIMIVKRDGELLKCRAKNVKVGENVYNEKGENDGYRVDVFAEYPNEN